MANIFQYGVKAANTLATATRAGLLSAAHFTLLSNMATWATRFRAGSAGHTGNVMVDAVAPDGYLVLNGQVSSQLASNTRLRDDASAWDHNNAAQPGQTLILRSGGGANTVEYWDSPAGGPPAVLTNRLSLSPADFSDNFVPPRARIRMAAQSIANTTSTAVVYTTDDGLTAAGYIGTAMWDGSTKFIARRAGWYLVTAYGYWTNVGTGLYREIGIWQNGAGYVANTDQSNPNFSASFFSQMSIATIIYLNLNDFVQTVVYQNSGAALNWNGGLMHIVRLSA